MKKKIKVRRTIQFGFFLLILLIAVNHTLVKSGRGISFLSSASLHSICPFGGVVSIYELLTVGTLVKKIHEASLILMILVLIISIGFGAIFCGWICPFGTVQEWISGLGRKVFKKHNRVVPYKIDKYLRFIRYFVLIWVIYMTAKSGKIVFEDIDPYYALFNFWTGEVAIAGIIILVATLVSSIFIERPWCKYLCPYGAVLGLGNIVRVFKIRRNSGTCIQCNACDKACPMNIKVSEKLIIKDVNCISCMKCTSEEICPIKDTVYIGTKNLRRSEIISKDMRGGGNENEIKL